jgi:hypothetical protein
MTNLAIMEKPTIRFAKHRGDDEIMVFLSLRMSQNYMVSVKDK